VSLVQAAAGRGFRHAITMVGDRHGQMVIQRDRDGQMVGVGVPDGVADAFPDNCVGMFCQVRRHPQSKRPDIRITVSCGMSLVSSSMMLFSAPQVELAAGFGLQVEDHHADVADDPIQVVDLRVQPIGHLGWSDPAVDAVEGEPDG
jgi:hypothetical protein